MFYSEGLSEWLELLIYKVLGTLLITLIDMVTWSIFKNGRTLWWQQVILEIQNIRYSRKESVHISEHIVWTET